MALTSPNFLVDGVCGQTQVRFTAGCDNSTSHKTDVFPACCLCNFPIQHEASAVEELRLGSRVRTDDTMVKLIVVGRTYCFKSLQ